MFVTAGSRWGRSPLVVQREFDKFYAYLNTATNTTTAGWQKVPLDTVTVDTGNMWDSINKRIVPKKPGYYQFIGRGRIGTVTTGGYVAGLGINGSQAIALAGTDNAGSGAFAVGGSVLYNMNGTTDYAELWIFCGQVRALTTGGFDTFMDVLGPF